MIIVCVSCNRQLKVPENFAGKRFNCPKCKVTQTAPLASKGASGSQILAPIYSESPPSINRSKPTPNLKPCPSCGESVLATAIQCPHCREHLDLSQAGQELIFDSGPRKASRKNVKLVYGGFGARFLAALVDDLLITIAGLVVGGIAGFLLAVLGSGTKHPDMFVIDVVISFIRAYLLIGPLVGVLYYTLLESSPAQATFGKRMMGLCVIDQDGNQISFLRAMGRHFGKLVSSLIFLVGYLMQPYTEKKQALHDIMAGTFVIKK